MISTTTALVVADAATRTYADTAIATAVAALVDSAPGALDTLNELAAAINDDANAFHNSDKFNRRSSS